MSFAKNGAILTDYSTSYVDVENQLDEGKSGTTKDIVLVNSSWCILSYESHHGKVVQLAPTDATATVHVALPTPVVGMKVSVRAGVKLTNGTAAYTVHATWTGGSGGTTGLTSAPVEEKSTADVFGHVVGPSSIPNLGSSTAQKDNISVAACEPYQDVLTFEAVSSTQWIVTGFAKPAVTSA